MEPITYEIIGIDGESGRVFIAMEVLRNLYAIRKVN